MTNNPRRSQWVIDGSALRPSRRDRRRKRTTAPYFSRAYSERLLEVLGKTPGVAEAMAQGHFGHRPALPARKHLARTFQPHLPLIPDNRCTSKTAKAILQGAQADIGQPRQLGATDQTRRVLVQVGHRQLHMARRHPGRRASL